jgi:hypothetical protein
MRNTPRSVAVDLGVRSARVLVAIALLAGCKRAEPPPGHRFVGRGTLQEVANDPRDRALPTRVDTYGNLFYREGDQVFGRRLMAGPQLLATAPAGYELWTTGSDVAYPGAGPTPGFYLASKWKLKGPTFIETSANPSVVTGYEPSGTLWAEPRSGGDSVLVYRTDDRPAATKEVGRVAGTVRQIVTSIYGGGYHREGFIVVAQTTDEYRIDLYDRLDAAPRTLHREPRARGNRDEEVFLSVALAKDHVFVAISRSTLVSRPVPLRIIPRAGGPAETYGKPICVPVGALETDAVFATAHEDWCGREFPWNQRFDLWRYSPTHKTATNIYASHVGDLSFDVTGGMTLLLRERIQRPRAEGDSPKYDDRTSSFTLTP